MATLTVYPDADPETTTVDGRVRHAGTNVTFATLRGGAGTNSNDTTPGSSTNSCGELEAGTTTDRYTQIERGIFLFDTSSIATGATVTYAEIGLRGVAKTSNLGTCDLDVVASNPASNTALVSADYATLNTTVLGTVTYASFNTSGYGNILLDNAAIIKNGITKLGTRIEWDTDNNMAGTWVSGAKTRFQCYYADQAGTTSDPKLNITYDEATSTMSPKYMFYARGRQT